MRGIALAIVVLVSACGGREDAPAPAPTTAAVGGGVANLTPRPAGAREVVARVGTAEIWDVDVARHAGAHALTPRQALDELIAIELLAAEAARRGLATDPDVAEVGEREAVRRLVDDYAARTATPELIPDQDVQVVWKRSDVQLWLNHGELRQVHYLRVPVRRTTPKPDIERLRTIADQVHAAVTAARPTTPEAFAAAGVAAGERAGVQLQGGPFSTMPDDGAAPPFRDATFKIKTIGGISPVTRTPWGWDIVYLVGITPPKQTSFAEAAADLRRKMWPDWRRVTFLRWLDELATARSIHTDPAPLGQLAGAPDQGGEPPPPARPGQPPPRPGAP